MSYCHRCSRLVVWITEHGHDRCPNCHYIKPCCSGEDE